MTPPRENGSRCAEMALLVQADLDGELDVRGAAMVAAHLADCPDCRATQSRLAALKARINAEVPRERAPEALRRALEAEIRAAEPAQAPKVVPLRRPPRLGASVGFAAGMGLAACLALILLPRPDSLAGDVVASHIRALQPGHLTDVLSTDQHTVKPWFDGRLDYAPPVKNLADHGFPLVGGRLDYMAGRPVAALAYNRAKHVIDLYLWPRGAGEPEPDGSDTRNGYNVEHGTAEGMEFWAVSDLNKAELHEFIAEWRAAK